MGLNRKIRIAQVLMVLLLCNQIYTLLQVSISSIYHLSGATQGKFTPKVSILFLAIVVSLCFSLLWRAQRFSFMLFVLGQGLVVIGAYDLLSLQKYALIALQLVGMILFSFGSVRILLFVLTQRGSDFIASTILRQIHRKES